MKIFTLFGLCASIAFLSGCNNDSSNPNSKAKELAQEVCLVNQEDDFNKCATGQRVFFQPQSFGNQQLPLIFISYFCDIHQPIHFNASGVVCIYQETKNKAEQ